MSETNPRKVTVTFEGVDLDGDAFTYSRTLDSTLSGDNPAGYARQVETTARVAAKLIAMSVASVYGDMHADPKGDQ